MSNKITLATIQFRADAKGANAALESMRQSSKDAHKEVDRLQEAFDKGIKTMKDVNGVDFDVAKKLATAKKEAKSFDQAIRELIKGATALETVVKNIRMGAIEDSSRAELKGAINAAESRKRSVRGSDPETLQMQRELNTVIEESRKQLNNLDRDTAKVIETIQQGGTISEAVLKKEQNGLREMLTLIPKGTEEWDRYQSQLQAIEQHVANIRRQEREAATSLLSSQNLGQYSEEQIRAAISSGKELLATYKTASPEAKALADNIARAEQHLKETGVEAARVAAREQQQLQTERELATTMNRRLRDLKNLSADALVETRKYWEAQRNGAAEGTAEFNKAEAALKKIDGYQRNARRTELGGILGDPSKYGIAEVRAAVQEAEKLRDSVQKGIPVWQQYNKMVEQGKAYLDGLARSEAADRINRQMQSLSTLSATGLQEVKRYWETMVSGAAQGSTELDQYRAKLEQVVAEEKARNTAAAQQRVGILGSGNLGQYSEAEIRAAIEAGNQLIKTYKTADPAAQALARSIVAAEEYLKQYGTEAERAARKEAQAVADAARKREEAHQAMEEQLRRGTGLTASALKQQESYWQRLADDPKAAANELARYYENLNKVRAIQKEQAESQVKANGISALNRFRGDMDYESKVSANQLKEDAAALKAYRDSLPKEGNLSLIREIDYYIGLTGTKAKESAQSVMSLADAEALAGKLGTKGFGASTEQLKAAKKALEEAQQGATRGSARFTQLQEAINKVDLELAKTGELAAEVKAVLDAPKGRSFNELKIAVEQGRAALANMRTTTKEEQKAFADLAAKVKEADFQMKQLAGSSKGTATAFEKAWSRLKTYIGLYVGAAVAMQKVVATMGDLMELSDKMGEVRKTTGFTADEVGRLSENLKRMDTRTTLVDLLGIAAEAGTLGLKTQQDIQGFTEAANMLMVSLPEMGQEAAKQLMKIANATGDLKKNGGDVEETMQRVGSTIIALRANSASAAPEITDFVSRVGAVGAQAGISIDQIAALGSTIDALGGRVEMSATALSRMIPAIRNNSFAIAESIGVTEEYLKSLAPMEQMVLIFRKMRDSIQGIDTTTEQGQEQMAKNVEDLLGKNATMREVMKDLEQQGARAGIVFGLLSQNVEELERQLGIASDAYEKNTALAAEYANMNETTAAKWARLKNQLEEFFVGDDAQRRLGWIIDRLRGIVDVLTGNNGLSVAMRTIITYWSLMKIGIGEALLVSLPKAIVGFRTLAVTAFSTIGTQIKAATYHLGIHTRATARAAVAMRSLNAAQIANFWIALGTAIIYATVQLYKWLTKISELDLALAKLDNEEAEAERSLNSLVNSFTAASKKTEETKKKQGELETQTEKLRKEVETLRNSTDKGAEATARLNQKEDELKKSEEELEKATKEANKANDERSKLITEINSKYSTYLGYMLDEKTAAEQVALAHMQIVAALKEELEQKRLNKEQESIDEEYNEKINKAGARGKASLGTLPADMQRRIESQWNTIRGRIQYSVDENGKESYTLPAIEGLGNAEVTKGSYKELRGELEKLFGTIVRQEVQEAQKVLDRNGNPIQLDFGTHKVQTGTSSAGIAVYSDVKNTVDDFISQAFNSFDRWTDLTMQREQKLEEKRLESQAYAQGAHANSVDAADKMNADAYSRITATLGTITGNQQLSTANIGTLAQQANIITANLTKYKGELKDADKFIGKDNEATLENAINTLYASLTEAQRKQILAAAKQSQSGGSGGGTGGNGGNNPYGQYNPVTSPYSDWNADDLVKRRKEMLERVRTLAAGADVQAVLSEDAAFITKATRDNIKTTKDAIDWYNAERLKIQDALHEKHLTNTGDWMDPSKARGRRKIIQDEWSAYLNELDAYYTERKAMIQEAQNDGEISEAEAWRRTLQNDAEWHQRRAELQKLYADKAGEVTREEQDAIFAIIGERTGDTADFIQKTIAKTVKFIYDIGNKSEAEQRTIFGKLDKGIEQDFLRQRNAIGKQMKAIQDIIDKERPFNGLAENLRENMVKMDALMTDVAEGERTRAEETRRMMFLLQEAENAYALTTEQLLADMRQRGFGAWADALSQDDSLQRALLVQLHQTYDAVQDAIKKESSLIKKQAENVWSSILMPDGVTPLKQAMEQSITTLGLQKDSVSRANSLIGAGQASERVADRLAIKQMQVQLAMQQAYYDLVRKTGLQRIADLKAAAKRAEDLGNTEEAARLTLDAQHATMSLNLATTKEQTELDKQRVAIANQLEESQNRLYKELREWGDLIASSLQSVFEASNTGQADFYNEIAKLRLTGDTGGGTYVVIDNAGTSDATAHYETYATEEEHLRRQLEIDQQNAVAEAWKKVMDDFNAKMAESITDWVNASLQNKAVEDNTVELAKNTDVMAKLTEAMGGLAETVDANTEGVANASNVPTAPSAPVVVTTQEGKKGTIEIGEMTSEVLGEDYQVGGDQANTDATNANTQAVNALTQAMGGQAPEGLGGMVNDFAADKAANYGSGGGEISPAAQQQIADQNAVTENAIDNKQKEVQTSLTGDQKIGKSSQSTFAKMVAATNLYGAAYQAMSNDNMDMAQKFEMIALQAVGNAAIAGLQVALSQGTAETAANMPAAASKASAEEGPIAGPILFAVLSALVGGLMGLAASKIAKSKSQIAQITGASASAGRLSTGMLTYAEGNVNEFTDPATLTPGRQYNVDAADGRTYRARYMGTNPRTHLTNGPEFHLSGERGREMIIDAGTTRQITMNEGEIWHAIQTLSGGGRISALRSQNRRRGVRAFADGNVSDFSEYSDYSDYSETSDLGMTLDQAAALQASIDRQSDLLADLRANGIKAHFDVYGKGGLIDSYDTGKKTVNRHGERY